MHEISRHVKCLNVYMLLLNTSFRQIYSLSPRNLFWYCWLNKGQKIFCQILEMYILASDFSEKTTNTYSKLENRVVCRVFLVFKYVFIVFFAKKQLLIYICTLKILKIVFKTSLSVHNINMYLCGQVENTKLILCSQKKGSILYLYLNFYVILAIVFYPISL